MIFPEKYRKALLNKMVIKIIEETLRIYKNVMVMKMKALGMDNNPIYLLSIAHSKIKEELWG